MVAGHGSDKERLDVPFKQPVNKLKLWKAGGQGSTLTSMNMFSTQAGPLVEISGKENMRTSRSDQSAFVILRSTMRFLSICNVNMR